MTSAPLSSIRLRCATANVLTLHPKEISTSHAQVSGVCMRTKATLLEKQFHDCQYDVIGVQEGRSQSSEQTEGQHYTMLAAAAAPDGSLGVQCWVKHGWHVQFWHPVSPRILYVVVARPGLEVGFLIAHSPHTMSHESTRLQWWADLSALMHTVSGKYAIPWIVLIDANGRVGSTPSSSCGPSRPEKENANGASLRTFCEQFHLKLANTWGPGGHTWTSTFGTTHRIDYIAVPAFVFLGIAQCEPNYDVDLTLNAKEDHNVVAMHAMLPVQPVSAGIVKRFSVNKYRLQDAYLRDAFQQLMWRFPEVPDAVHPDDHVELLNSWTRWAATHCFGPPARRPRQAWLSPRAWEIVRHIAPLRRARHRITVHRRQCFLAMAWHSWKEQVPDLDVPFPCSTGLWADTRRAFRGEASVTATIFSLQKAVKPIIDDDRQAYLDSMAGSISSALDRADIRQAFVVLRALGTRASKPSQCLRRGDGTLTNTTAEVHEVWQQHIATVFQGQVVPRSALRPEPGSNLGLTSSLDVGPEATRVAYRALGRNKGVGYDGIPAELLQAGESALATKYAAVNQRVHQTSVWPSQWCGGRSQEVFKRKGDPCETDDYRNILLADHASKGLAGILQQDANQAYIEHQPESQFGAIPKRGTDMASHTIHSMIDYAAQAKLSILVLFMDLTKAFDRVIRQLIYGWGTIPRSEHRQSLLDLQVAPDAADWMLQYLDERGPLVQQWGLDAATAAMMRTLHEGAWAAVADLPTCVTSRTGGRQGCKLGALTFNGVYGIALDMIAWEAKRAGIALELNVPDGAFWSAPGAPAASSHHVLDAAFIDDEALAIVAQSAEELDRHIDQLLLIVFSVCEKLHLKINVAKGKTEALLVYRGRDAKTRREARRQDDGTLGMSVPQRDLCIHVVESYKHLGTFTSLRDSCMADVNTKVARTLQSYAPLSWKVFGSIHAEMPHTLMFMQCLLLSKLLFGVEVLVPTPRQLRKLNSVYMTILRRIANEPRFCRTEHTDREIRDKLGQPAIECVIARMRLRYL